MQNEIIMYDITLTVKVRKYPIDNLTLGKMLKQAKKNVGLSNKDIARILKLPLTQVEHWFRLDTYFAIPDATIWFNLKDLLSITDDSYDLAITTFEERDGVYDKSNRLYDSNGIAPTITTMSANEKVLIRNE